MTKGSLPESLVKARRAENSLELLQNYTYAWQKGFPGNGIVSVTLLTNVRCGALSVRDKRTNF
jgi:hypothetical protein